MGTTYVTPNRHDLVTGAHKFPSDMTRPGMLYGAILRPPTYGAKLASVDLGPAQAMDGVIVVQDGEFVGVAAPTSYQARQAIAALAATAEWTTSPLPSTAELYDHLRASMPMACRPIRMRPTSSRPPRRCGKPTT